MFTVNEDLSIYATRGDIVFFTVTAEDNGYPYHFQPGDILRMAIYGRKDATMCVMQKDFAVEETCERFMIYLEEQDTKIGEIISKPKDYWYEVVLNPDTQPQTIIGYDEDGAKVFKLMPESEEIEDDYKPKEEDFPVVDSELDIRSPRPVSNSAVARAVAQILGVCERTHDEVANKFVTPEMFGAIGDGVANDTECIQFALDSGARTVFLHGDYRITDSLIVRSNTVVMFSGTIYCDKGESYYSAIRLEDVENVALYNPFLVCSYDIDSEWSHGIFLNRTKNVSLYNVVCQNFADGVCVSYSLDSESYNDNLYMDSVTADKCKRNGVTIECCKDAYIGRIIGNEIGGFAPNACLDIEHDKTGLVIDNLVIDHVYSNKCAGGVNFVLDGQAKAKVNSIEIVDGAFYFTGSKSDVTINSLRCIYSDGVYDFKIMDNASVALNTKLRIGHLAFEGNGARASQLVYIKCNSNTFVDVDIVKIIGVTANYLYYVDNHMDSNDFDTHCRLYGVDGFGNKVTRRASVKWVNEFSSVFEDEVYSYSPVLLLGSSLTKIRNEWAGCEVTFELVDGGSLTVCEFSNYKPSAVLKTAGDRIHVRFEQNDESSKAIWKVKGCFLLTNV